MYFSITCIQTVTLIVEDDSILSDCNSLDCHLVPVGTSSQIQAEMFITHKMKLEWSRDGYSVATLNNFLYVGGGYNPSEGNTITERLSKRKQKKEQNSLKKS